MNIYLIPIIVTRALTIGPLKLAKKRRFKSIYKKNKPNLCMLEQCISKIEYIHSEHL